MEETDLDMLSFEQRTELEGHLYSFVYHNTSTCTEDYIKEQFDCKVKCCPEMNFEKNKTDDVNFINFKSVQNCKQENNCRKRKLDAHDDVISIISTDSNDDEVIEIREKSPTCITIDSEDDGKETHSKLQKPSINLNVTDDNIAKPDVFNISLNSQIHDDFLINDCDVLNSTTLTNFSFNVDGLPSNDCVPENSFKSNAYENDSSSENSEFLVNDISVHSGKEVDLKNVGVDTPSTQSKFSMKIKQSIQLPIESKSSKRISLVDTKKLLKPKLNCVNKERWSMHEYYTTSWGGENFDHNNIIANMPTNKDKWRIHNSDLYGHVKRSRWQKIRCRNCHQMGHPLVLCPEPKHVIKCHMCGLDGHTELRCPNKICLKCGAATSSFIIGCLKCKSHDRMICSICNMVGHSREQCPDLWRRYHRSTDATKLPISQTGRLKEPQHLYCSNCSMRGHVYHNCSKIKYNNHSLQLPNIIEYNPVFPLETTKNYKPKDSINKHYNSSLLQNDKINEQTFLNSLNEFEAVASDDNSESCNSFMEVTENHFNDSSIISDKNSFNKFSEKAESDIDNSFLNNVISNIENRESVSIIVDKDTMAMLMKSDGTKFLQDISKTLGMKIELKFSSSGGSLLLNGTEKQCVDFQKSLKDWIKAINSKLLLAACSCNLPKKCKTLLSFIQENKASMNKPMKNPLVSYKILSKMRNNLSGVMNNNQVRTYNKNLRTLNIFFFGQNGFRDGKMHMEKLNDLIKKLTTVSQTCEVTPRNLYEEIQIHYKYIFSAVDHGNYEELLKLYKTQKLSQKNNKTTQNLLFHKMKCRNEVMLQCLQPPHVSSKHF